MITEVVITPPPLPAQWEKDQLARLRATWQGARDGYRDAVILVGQLIHQFVLDTLRQAAGSPLAERVRDMRTRMGSLKRVASALRIPTKRVSLILHVTMTTTLLCPEEEYGTLSYACLREFKVLVDRTVRGYKRRKANNLDSKPDMEEWVVKAEVADSAPALFRRAVVEGWSCQRAAKEVTALVAYARPPMPKGGAPKRRRDYRQEHLKAECKDGGDAANTALRMASLGTPKDVAAMCVELVQHSQDPREVAGHLLALLTNLFPKRCQ